jgi:hypothetical protein
MNPYFILAGLLCFFVGITHSVFGEMLIFRRLRQGGWIPTNGGRLLSEKHVRIIWASWHFLTVLGWLIAVLLIWLALPAARDAPHDFVERAIVIAMLLGALLVLIGTRAKHPGWLGLITVAALTLLGHVGA